MIDRTAGGVMSSQAVDPNWPANRVDSRPGSDQGSSAETTLDTVSAPKSAYPLPSSPISTPRLHFVLPLSTRLPKFTRAKRSWRPSLVLQERDLDLLRTAADYRLITTPQYLLLYFEEGRDGIYRRLQTLFHHGYLDRLGTNPNAPMLYALGRRGAEALEVSYRKEVGDRYVAHQLMIGQFRIALTLAARAAGIEFDWLRLPVDLPLRPDGFFALRFSDLPEGRNRAFFFLEADRSTMTRERFVKKLEAYQSWYEADGHTGQLGIRNFRVLTVTKSDERATSLMRAATATRALSAGLPRFWFASNAGLALSCATSRMLDPIWRVPGQTSEDPQSLVPGALGTVARSGIGTQ